ncbi:hypothetical protein CPC08DRAFT_770525 [Agrocybe pediades]|nr:hypothetical protein CPC08DRAFT_770525 [Agrocybe pediades]
MGEHDVDIKIEFCGVCCSDIRTITGGWGKVNLPVIVGHEIVGCVTQVGGTVAEFKSASVFVWKIQRGCCSFDVRWLDRLLSFGSKRSWVCLSHMAIQFAKAVGCDEIVAFSHLNNKEKDAMALDATDFVATREERFQKPFLSFLDFIIVYRNFASWCDAVQCTADVASGRLHSAP